MPSPTNRPGGFRPRAREAIYDPNSLSAIDGRYPSAHSMPGGPPLMIAQCAVIACPPTPPCQSAVDP